MSDANEAGKATKPFYKKWWFITLCILLIIGIIAPKNNDAVSTKNNETNNTTIIKDNFIPYEMEFKKMYLAPGIKIQDMAKVDIRKVLPLDMNVKINVDKDNIILTSNSDLKGNYQIIKMINENAFEIKDNLNNSYGKCVIIKSDNIFGTDFGNGVAMFTK